MRDMNAKGATMNVTQSTAWSDPMFPLIGTKTTYRNDHVSDHTPYTTSMVAGMAHTIGTFPSVDQALAGAKLASVGSNGAMVVWMTGSGETAWVAPLGSKHGTKSPFQPLDLQAGSEISITAASVAYLVDGDIVFEGPASSVGKLCTLPPGSSHSQWEPVPPDPQNELAMQVFPDKPWDKMKQVSS